MFSPLWPSIAPKPGWGWVGEEWMVHERKKQDICRVPQLTPKTLMLEVGSFCLHQLNYCCPVYFLLQKKICMLADSY